jgi:ferredoxin
MIIKITETGSLKNILENMGYLFPCGGKGLCGRCKITASEFSPTSLDKRFLSEHELSEGIRLACDKEVVEPVEIDCELREKPKDIKPEHPASYVIFGEKETEIGLTDDGMILENIVLPSCPPITTELKAQFNLHAIEMFEKFKVAKAETIIILGTPERVKAITNIDVPFKYGDMYYAIDMNLPGEDVYIPPVPTPETGSHDLVELLDIPENSLVISGPVFMYKGEDILCITSDKDCISGYGKLAFKATLQYFIQETKPENIFTFENVKESIEAGAKLIERRARYLATELLISNKRKAELNRLAKRTVTMAIADDDLWQDILSRIKLED